MKEFRKAIIFLPDGMADDPLPELNGKTPLEFAKTPAMDSIAATQMFLPAAVAEV